MKKRHSAGQSTKGAVPRGDAGRYADQATDQAAQPAQADGWCDLDPGFCLAAPDAEAIVPCFSAWCGDPTRIDPGFLIPPPDRPIR